MPTILEYMQFATGVYAASDKNTVGDPAGWTLNAWQPDTASGFSAGYYFNSQSNEVVISYTGTNDWIDKVNWTTGAGLPLPQIFDAVSYYFRVKAAFRCEYHFYRALTGRWSGFDDGGVF